jgi:hypothetical protein
LTIATTAPALRMPKNELTKWALSWSPTKAAIFGANIDLPQGAAHALGLLDELVVGVAAVIVVNGYFVPEPVAHALVEEVIGHVERVGKAGAGKRTEAHARSIPKRGGGDVVTACASAPLSAAQAWVFGCDLG